MIRKSAQYEQAKELRMRGFTYAEVAKIVGVAKSTVSLWFSRETWSANVAEDNTKRAAKENKKRITLLNKARSNQFRKLYTEAERSATTEFKHYKSNPLFIAGLMLYLSKGDHSNSPVICISSSRKEIHRLFIRFSTEFLGVQKEKMRFWLLLNSSHSAETCSRSWSKEIGLSVKQFHKNQITKNNNIGSTLHDGVGNTIIGGTLMKKKLQKWVETALLEL
ncbi:MAG: hypothetical protein K9M10_02650 [Candidatus Pacebacteria bacterium]|nr:hypothetical protein [Candidatus Paceibacterota bacterium]MCF7857355.1 hypothetical protein [Candidatus Paceibacterota bacterium]